MNSAIDALLSLTNTMPTNDVSNTINLFMTALTVALFTLLAGAIILFVAGWAINLVTTFDLEKYPMLTNACFGFIALATLSMSVMTWKSVGSDFAVRDSLIETYCVRIVDGIANGEIKAIDEGSSARVIQACGRERFLVAANSSGSKLALAFR